MTTRQFAYKYSEYTLGVLLAICIFGVLAGNAAIKGELDEMILPNNQKRKNYKRHLESYVEMGNVWEDPDYLPDKGQMQEGGAQILDEPVREARAIREDVISSHHRSRKSGKAKSHISKKTFKEDVSYLDREEVDSFVSDSSFDSECSECNPRSRSSRSRSRQRSI